MSKVRGARQEAAMTGPDACGNCRFFVHEPRELERALPGLNILSSAFGSVRADTGLCRVSETLVTSRMACVHFRTAETATGPATRPSRDSRDGSSG